MISIDSDSSSETTAWLMLKTFLRPYRESKSGSRTFLRSKVEQLLNHVAVSLARIEAANMKTYAFSWARMRYAALTCDRARKSLAWASRPRATAAQA